MKKQILIMAAILSILFAPCVFAQEQTVWDQAKSEQYGTKAGGMLGRGLLNAVTCFVDLIVHTVDGTQQGPPFVGTLTGLGSGIGCTVLRAGAGVLDVDTFWVPGFNGIPVSRSYHDCLEEDPAAPAQAATPAYAPASSTYAAPAEPVVKKRRHNAMDYVKK